MGLALLVAVAGLWFGAFAANPDTLSPAKFFLLVLSIFFAEIFYVPTSAEIYATYVCFLGIAGVAIILERTQRPHGRRAWGRNRVAQGRSERGSITAIWLISLVAIASQLYLILLFGGIEGYINSIGLRVQMMRGLGHLRLAAGLIYFLNGLYFAALLARKAVGVPHWLLFVGHLMIAIAIALLSGSRGAVLWSLVYLAGIYHYRIRPIRVTRAALLVAVSVGAAVVIGTAREGYRWTDAGLQTGFDREVWRYKTTVFRYGLIPLELVFSREPQRLQLGMTFAAALTNFVPRSLWPNKPDTGGVVLTRDFTGDAWGGASYLAPGLVGEAILNFGHAGVIVGFALLVLLVLLNNRLYNFMLRKNGGGTGAPIYVLGYLIVVASTCGLLYGEFAGTFVKMMAKLVPLGLIYLVVFRVRVFAQPPSIGRGAFMGARGPSLDS